MAQKFSEISMVANQLAQRLAIDKFHRDEVRAIVLADLIDMSNVRMVKRRRGLSFANEPLHSVAIRGHFSRQNLQSNFAIQLCILRQINFAHSTLANLRADFVATKFCAYSKHPMGSCNANPTHQVREARIRTERIELWLDL